MGTKISSFHIQLFGPDLTNVAAVGLVVDGSASADFFSEVSSVTTTRVNTYPPIIDAFNHSQIAISRSAVGSEFNAYQNPITLTGEVEISAEIFATDGIGQLTITGNGDSLVWSQGPMVLAGDTLVWDGADGSPATDLVSASDFTEENALALELTIDSLVFDGAISGGVGIAFSLVSRANPAELFTSPTFQLIAPVSETTTIVVPFELFTGEGSGAPTPAELSEIASLALEIDGGTQTAFSLGLAELQTVPVPEPSLVPSLMAGCAVLLAVQRRRCSRRSTP